MNTKSAVVTTIVAVVDVVVVCKLLMHGAGPITTKRCLQVAGLVAIMLLVQGVGAFKATGMLFLPISVLWVFLAVALPICALRLLLVSRRRPVEAPVRGLAWMSLATVPLSFHASFVEPFRLITERHSVPIAHDVGWRRPLVVGVLADIQCEKVLDHHREAVRRVMEAKPDLIVLPGDYAQVGSHRIPEIAPDFRALLAPLDAPLGVWCVAGDTDKPADIWQLIEGTRVRFLQDEVVELGTGNERVLLAGISLHYDGPEALAALADLEARPGEALRLVFAHRPDVVYGLAQESPVDLVIAGHTHGGQVSLPFFGPPIVSTKVGRRVGAGGLHEVNGSLLYVSRGVGWENHHAPRIRVLCPPEVSLLTLASAP